MFTGLSYQYVVSLGDIFASWKNPLRTKLADFQCFSVNVIIIKRVFSLDFMVFVQISHRLKIIKLVDFLTPHQKVPNKQTNNNQLKTKTITTTIINKRVCGINTKMWWIKQVSMCIQNYPKILASKNSYLYPNQLCTATVTRWRKKKGNLPQEGNLLANLLSVIISRPIQL